MNLSSSNVLIELHKVYFLFNAVLMFSFFKSNIIELVEFSKDQLLVSKFGVISATATNTLVNNSFLLVALFNVHKIY